MDSERKKHLLEHPEDADPKEFTYTLLDQIFRHRYGYGGSKQEMIIGGIDFMKLITPEFSNSGKSKNFTITICGGGYVFQRKSIYANNKRNRRQSG